MPQKRIGLLHLVVLSVVMIVGGSCAAPNVSSIATATVTADPGSDVVLYRGNLQRTGIYDVSAIREEPQIKWQAKVGSTWLMPPLVADGMLYAGSGDGVLYALNAETGEQVWSADGFGQLETTGVIGGKMIVTGGYSQLVKALDLKTGEERWSFNTSFPVQGAPLIVDGTLYIATDHEVYSLNLESGELHWKVPTGKEGAFMGPPAYEDGVIYTTAGKLLLALDAGTGKELWRVEKDEMFTGLAVANQTIYVGNFDQSIYAYDQATGEERWKFDGDDLFWSFPAVNDKVVYTGNGTTLYALDAGSGELLWSFKTAGRSVSEPLLLDDVVYVSDSSHEFPRASRHLYALNASTGEQLWVFETVSTFLPAPAVGDGVVYVTSTGEVFALETP